MSNIFHRFLHSSRSSLQALSLKEASLNGPSLKDFIAGSTTLIPYNNSEFLDGAKKQVYIETYGCQMNSADTEIVHSILQSSGYARTSNASNADVVLLMTCAIRENAEDKIWHRLEYFKSSVKRKSMMVGVLGCMAERLKHKLLDERKLVDVVCGPDAYRDLPRLLSRAAIGESGINVALSLEETYADVSPVRVLDGKLSAFVSIMRGCDNMCSYCIVPFTRGRERSRPLASIVDEVRALKEQGVKEIVLLGQNVNSYRDSSDPSVEVKDSVVADGFKTIYKSKKGGKTFTDLLDEVSRIDEEMRIRFMSPHPKDFSDDLLHLIASRPNICKGLHLPAQSGSTAVLERMRRGYTREAYLNLIEKVKKILPDASLTSDFISGFCGESDADHKDTLSLIQLVGYDMAYMFAYSVREKTHAHRNYTDDVDELVKQSRLAQVISTFNSTAKKISQRFIGTRQLVLIDGESKKSSLDWSGRSDGNRTVVFPKTSHELRVGDYALVEITATTGATLIGRFIEPSSISHFNNKVQK